MKKWIAFSVLFISTMACAQSYPPTSSSNNSNNLQCLATVTIYAKVIGSPGYADSAVQSASFTLVGAPAPPTGVGVFVIGPGEKI